MTPEAAAASQSEGHPGISSKAVDAADNHAAALHHHHRTVSAAEVAGGSECCCCPTLGLHTWMKKFKSIRLGVWALCALPTSVLILLLQVSTPNVTLCLVSFSTTTSCGLVGMVSDRRFVKLTPVGARLNM